MLHVACCELHTQVACCSCMLQLASCKLQAALLQTRCKVSEYCVLGVSMRTVMLHVARCSWQGWSGLTCTTHVGTFALRSSGTRPTKSTWSSYLSSTHEYSQGTEQYSRVWPRYGAKLTSIAAAWSSTHEHSRGMLRALLKQGAPTERNRVIDAIG